MTHRTNETYTVSECSSPYFISIQRTFYIHSNTLEQKTNVPTSTTKYVRLYYFSSTMNHPNTYRLISLYLELQSNRKNHVLFNPKLMWWKNYILVVEVPSTFSVFDEKQILLRKFSLNISNKASNRFSCKFCESTKL